MPRVSDEHLTARRQQILDAARIRFIRNGFHATSMKDVIAEAGLSVGAVYRYFKSKEDLIAAIATEVLEEVIGEIAAIAKQEPVPTLDAAVEWLLVRFEPRLGPEGHFRIAVQVWAESLRNPALADLIKQVYGTIRGHLIELVRRSRQAGHLPPEADPEGVGAVLFGMLLGYLIQQTLTGWPDRDTFLSGVRALVAPEKA